MTGSCLLIATAQNVAAMCVEVMQEQNSSTFCCLQWKCRQNVFCNAVRLVRDWTQLLCCQHVCLTRRTDQMQWFPWHINGETPRHWDWHRHNVNMLASQFKSFHSCFLWGLGLAGLLLKSIPVPVYWIAFCLVFLEVFDAKLSQKLLISQWSLPQRTHFCQVSRVLSPQWKVGYPVCYVCDGSQIISREICYFRAKTLGVGFLWFSENFCDGWSYRYGPVIRGI